MSQESHRGFKLFGTHRFLERFNFAKKERGSKNEDLLWDRYY